MKSTGIVRKVDELGRIVIPKELRRSLKINEGAPLEIFVDNEKIIVQKYHPANECMITGEVSKENVQLYKGITLSPKGIELLKEELKNIS